MGTSLVVQRLRIRFPMQGTGFNPWSGNYDPTWHAAAKPQCALGSVCPIEDLTLSSK